MHKSVSHTYQRKRSFFWSFPLFAVLLFIGFIACSQQSGTTSGQTSVYNIEDFGAVGDSATVNTEAIQKAIGQAHQDSGGTVLIPEGVFSSGSIYLKENVHLKVAEGGKLRGIAGNENYPTLENTRIAGLTVDWPSALVNAINTKNVKISGKGTIDGSGYYWWEDYWEKRDSLSGTMHPDIIDWHVPRPRLVFFDSVSVSSIEDISLENSGFWTVHILYSNRIDIKGVDIDNPAIDREVQAASTDGIDIDSSSDIYIRNCSINVDDDCIALKSGRYSDGLEIDIPTENVVVENCHFGRGHGGVSIGTETAGGVKNVMVRNNTSDGNQAPIKFKARPGRGGVIENITHVGWDIKNAGTVIHYALREANGEDYTDPWTEETIPFEKATPRYRNITIRDLEAIGAEESISFLGWPLAHAQNVILEDVSIEAETGAEFQYIDNLLLKNVYVDAPGQSMEFTGVPNRTQK
ncbi:glycoside hydrolase family 28 protein [Aliifodinibius sp. S!AR15-10]|uniref:glycoside hydrolase family 28 protein n=1 Tax=Aliifodinibius sp. S!AR15-10 TaxID=2950437 RepID=UPI00286488C4|nr:glycoside hydrolase family 28 protein [Aliifodinibius sp. S!AR15-10]MDR8391953.1 glycoside hydrolase family 28 protein [Aliifodinibius sp. S!AR15-10]